MTRPEQTVLQVYDTLSRQKRPFVPQDPNRVSLYVCGPTVYNYAHIGNARPVVVFDTLFRLLRSLYGPEHVIYARNITDVDDKINARAAEMGVEISVITEKYAQIYRDDMAALNALSPNLEPKVTAHMAAIVDQIAALIDRGHAYVAEGHVLFDVTSFSDYGQLSGRSLEDMIAGARVEVAPYKKSPQDFVLWKPSKPSEPAWNSPWGAGRPGWHIECSAMIAHNLGLPIDIHGGGHDLTFPHHENEIAQGRCAHDHGSTAHEVYANYWMHNGFLNFGEEKMSKSLGNVKLVHDLIEQWPGEVLRLALLSAHYRAPLDWNDDLLVQCKKRLDGLYGTLRRAKDLTVREDQTADLVLDALLDDLNTPRAMAELSTLAKALETAETPEAKSEAKGALLAAGHLLGLLQVDPDQWFEGKIVAEDKAKIDALVTARTEARATKNWAEADRIREALTALKVEVMDGPQGASWRFIDV